MGIDWGLLTIAHLGIPPNVASGVMKQSLWLHSQMPSCGFPLSHPQGQESISGKTMHPDMGHIDSKAPNPYPFRELSKRAWMSRVSEKAGPAAAPLSLSLLYVQKSVGLEARFFVCLFF